MRRMGYARVAMKEADRERLKLFLKAALDRDDASFSSNRAEDAKDLVFVIVRLGGVPMLTVTYDSRRQQVHRVRPCTQQQGDKEARAQSLKLLQQREALREVLRSTIPPAEESEGCLF